MKILEIFIFVSCLYSHAIAQSVTPRKPWLVVERYDAVEVCHFNTNTQTVEGCRELDYQILFKTNFVYDIEITYYFNNQTTVYYYQVTNVEPKVDETNNHLLQIVEGRNKSGREIIFSHDFLSKQMKLVELCYMDKENLFPCPSVFYFDNKVTYE